MFETHAQYTVALLSAVAGTPGPDHRVEVAGVADSASAFETQSRSPGIRLSRAAMGTNDEVPLLPSQAAEAVLAKMRKSGDFAHGGGCWRCFPLREFHETDDKNLWEGQQDGWPLWKGESFDQHMPTGKEARWISAVEVAIKKARKTRPGGDSVLASEVSQAKRREAVAAEVGNVRLAFRDVTRSTDSRTVRASLIPPNTFLTNKAPYLAFVDGNHRERAACCAVMNSLPFDWQARRFVEINLNYFILELLTVPKLSDPVYGELVELGARLSCPDERFAEVAEACGTTVDVLPDDERLALRARVDALVAHSYELTCDDLEVIFADFTADAVPAAHRTALREELDGLHAAPSAKAL